MAISLTVLSVNKIKWIGLACKIGQGAFYFIWAHSHGVAGVLEAGIFVVVSLLIGVGGRPARG